MRQLTTKPLSWFKIDNIREHLDEAEDRLLGESLAARQIHPVIARADGTILDGARRHRGATMVGKETLEVVITDEPLTPPEVREIQLVSAFHRSDLTGWEKWQAILAIREAHPAWAIKDLAAHLRIDPKMVKVLLSPSGCTAEVQVALRDRRIGISDCYAISLAPVEQQPALLALKRSGASRDALARRGRRLRGDGPEPAVRACRIACPLSSGVRVVVIGEDLGLDEFIEALCEAQKEAREGLKKNLSPKTWQAAMLDRSRLTG